MNEPFDIKKLAASPFTGLFWVKTIMFMLGMACIVFIGYGVYKAYFKKPAPTTTQNNQADIIKYDYQQPHTTFGCTNTQVRNFYYGKEVKK